jgi:hypothetical protein
MNAQQSLGRTLPIFAGRAVREVVLVAVGLLVYFLVRGNVAERAGMAFHNAADVIRAERALGIFWEPAMQAWIMESTLQIRFWNWIYFWVHAPAIVLIGLWLLWSHPRTYGLIRNAFLVSAVLALVCYGLYPLAPPRLLPEYGFVDTMAQFSQTSYQAQSLKLFVNPYAAMPSLHFGWAFLCGVAVAMVWRNWRGILLGILLPVSMGLAIVFTANHYILDGVAGFAVCLAGLAVAIWWDRGRPLPRRRPAPHRRPVRLPSTA